MGENQRLAEILQGYGEVFEDRTLEEVRPIFENGVWCIPLGDQQVLRVEEAALPFAVQGLLRLYVEAVTQPSGNRNRDEALQVVRGWLAGEGTVEEASVIHALTQLGLAGGDLLIVVIQAGKSSDETMLDDAVQLLQSLLEEQQALVVRVAGARMYVLLSGTSSSPPEELAQSVSAWIDTLSTELFLLCQAGVSTKSADLSQLKRVRDEAEFALRAGLLYRSKEAVHEFGRLGLARVLYGMPKGIRQAYLAEVLPEAVLANLTPELRETIFAFFEHGQQVADTARGLFIHRNTLLYRLERIAELTGHDVRKPMQGFTLWLALTLSRTDSPNAGE